MTRQAFMELLAECERRFPVDRWMLGGEHIWPLIRITLYSSACNAIVEGAALGGALSNARFVSRALLAWAGAVVRDPAANRSPRRRCEVLFLASSIGRQPIVCGRRVNTLVAPFVELFQAGGWTTAAWEMSLFGEYNVPRYTPSFLLQPWLLQARLRTYFRHGDLAEDLPQFDEFLEVVRKAGLDWRFERREALRRDGACLLAMARMFEPWLRASRPRLVAVSGYGLAEQGLALACAKLGIATMDTQHGVQGELHPAYGGWTRVPASGYALMPKYYWCWDDESATAINTWTAKAGLGVRAVVGGNPFADIWRTAGSTLATASSADLARARSGLTASRHILVSLDSMEHPVPERLRELLSKAPRGWCFWLRLHPVNQPRQRAALRLEIARHPGWHLADWRAATELPLPSLLAQSDAHVTVSWSSVVKEAAAEGLASVACSFRASEFFPLEIGSGMLVAAEEPAAIIAAVERQFARRHAPAAASPGAPALRFLDSVT